MQSITVPIAPKSDVVCCAPVPFCTTQCNVVHVIFQSDAAPLHKLYGMGNQRVARHNACERSSGVILQIKAIKYACGHISTLCCIWLMCDCVRACVCVCVCVCSSRGRRRSPPRFQRSLTKWALIDRVLREILPKGEPMEQRAAFQVLQVGERPQPCRVCGHGAGASGEGQAPRQGEHLQHINYVRGPGQRPCEGVGKGTGL